MNVVYLQLADAIRELAANAPLPIVKTLANALEGLDQAALSRARPRLLSLISTPQSHAQLERLLSAWQANPQVTGASIALALLSTAQAEEHHRHGAMTELVWTGPDSRVIPLRRTDQALLQLIQRAKTRLLRISFAVYKIEQIAQAIVAAAERGVSISICIESAQVSEGKLAYDTLKALGPAVARSCRVYAWPLSKRIQSPDGKTGSLHAKAAVADGNWMLLSSANLTAYAMNLNMELGILVRGGNLPSQVEKHFDELIAHGYWNL